MATEAQVNIRPQLVSPDVLLKSLFAKFTASVGIAWAVGATAFDPTHFEILAAIVLNIFAIPFVFLTDFFQFSFLAWNAIVAVWIVVGSVLLTMVFEDLTDDAVLPTWPVVANLALMPAVLAGGATVLLDETLVFFGQVWVLIQLNIFMVPSIALGHISFATVEWLAILGGVIVTVGVLAVINRSFDLLK